MSEQKRQNQDHDRISMLASPLLWIPVVIALFTLMLYFL